MSDDSPSEFLTDLQLRMQLGDGNGPLSPSTTQAWRRTGRGPRYIRLGRLVRYRKVDVEAWLAKHTVGV